MESITLELLSVICEFLENEDIVKLIRINKQIYQKFKSDRLLKLLYKRILPGFNFKEIENYKKVLSRNKEILDYLRNNTFQIIAKRVDKERLISFLIERDIVSKWAGWIKSRDLSSIYLYVGSFINKKDTFMICNKRDNRCIFPVGNFRINEKDRRDLLLLALKWNIKVKAYNIKARNTIQINKY